MPFVSLVKKAGPLRKSTVDVYEIEPRVMPDVFEMPIERQDGTSVFLRDDCNIAVCQIDAFPLLP
jgi:hypothetical protein